MRIKQPDLQYLNDLLKYDPPETRFSQIDLGRTPSSGAIKRIIFGKDVYTWRKTNHKDVRLHYILPKYIPNITPTVVDSLVQGTATKVSDSKPGWILYRGLGGNNLIEGEFTEEILSTLAKVHTNFSSRRDELRFVPEYRPSLLAQAIRCHLLPPIKYLINHYEEAKCLQELWSDIELLVQHYYGIVRVFVEGDLTLVHGAIDGENVFIDTDGRCKLLHWGEAHWATPYIDICRLLALGFEFDHLFEYVAILSGLTKKHLDEQYFAFCLNVSIVFVLFERVSWRVRQLKALCPKDIYQERNLQAEIDLVYRLAQQGITIYKNLQQHHAELGYQL